MKYQRLVSIPANAVLPFRVSGDAFKLHFYIYQIVVYYSKISIPHIVLKSSRDGLDFLVDEVGTLALPTIIPNRT